MGKSPFVWMTCAAVGNDHCTFDKSVNVRQITLIDKADDEATNIRMACGERLRVLLPIKKVMEVIEPYF